MIPFSELQRLADKCSAKLGVSCMISLEYWSWAGELEGSDLRYKLHISNGGDHFYSKTVQEFKAAIDNVLNPPIDTGVEISAK